MRKLQHILWAHDFQPASIKAGQVVADLAWRFDSQVTMFHVVADAGSPVTNDNRRQLGQRLLDEASQELTRQKVEVREATVVTGSAAERILRKADELDVDLIVIGSGNEEPRGDFVAGLTATAIVEHARRPVLVVTNSDPSPTFRRVFCPIDFSETSRRGLNNAIQLATAFRGELVVGTVFPAGGWIESLVELGTGLDVDKEVEQGWRADFETAIRRTEFGGIVPKTEERRGVPHEQIVRMARDHDCDVIVMGATGKTGLARLLLGSVTRRVLRHLPCSILVVHDEDLLVKELCDEDLRRSRLLYAEASALLESCMYEDALKRFDQVLAHNPLHVAAIEGRATACEHLGQSERAARCRRRAAQVRAELELSTTTS